MDAAEQPGQHTVLQQIALLQQMKQLVRLADYKLFYICAMNLKFLSCSFCFSEPIICLFFSMTRLLQEKEQMEAQLRQLHELKRLVHAR